MHVDIVVVSCVDGVHPNCCCCCSLNIRWWVGILSHYDPEPIHPVVVVIIASNDGGRVQNDDDDDEDVIVNCDLLLDSLWVDFEWIPFT